MDDNASRLNAEELLGELSWLRRLARSLVGSVGIEDDLVQETWLAASRVEGEVSRAWLVGTLSKLAARWYRGEARLAQREGAVAKPEAVDIGSHLERNELLAMLLGELRSLDEPFRTTLLLLYQDGLSVQGVAARLGAPEDTIRWRRREGLVRLRSRLDAASDRGAGWRGVFLPASALSCMESSGTLPALGATVGSLTTFGASVVILKSVVGAALCVAVWWLIGVGGDVPSNVSPAVPVAQGAGEAVEVVQLAELDELAPVPAGEARGAVPAPRPLAPSGPTVEVHVVDFKGRPVVGASVWVSETSETLDPGVDSRPTDAEGIAHIPVSSLGMVNWVSAMTDELYGVVSYLPQFHSGDCTVTMFPDEDVEVLILGSDGQPIEGVPVGLVHRFALKDRPDVQNLRFKRVAHTGSNGLGLIRHVRTPSMYRGGSAEIQVGPAVLLGSRPDVTLDALDLPHGSIRIVLPEMGSLAIKVFESGGRQSHASGTLRLAVDAAPSPSRDLGDLRAQLRLSPRGRVAVDFERGVGVVPFIGLRLPLIARALDVEPTDSTIGVGAGPVSEDMSETLTLRPMKSTPELVGVLLNGGGEPIVRTPVKLSVRAKGKVERTGATAQTITDERGGFRVHLSEDVLEAWGRTQVHELQVFVDGADPLETLTAGAALPERLEQGDNNVGTLRCLREEPILRGRALDVEGEPVQLMASSLAVMIGVGPGLKSFRFLDHARFVVDRERFALFAPDPVLRGEIGESFYITANAEGRPWVRQEVLPGVAEVELRFEVGAQIAGAVVTEEGQSPIHYSAKFYCEDPGGVERPYGRSTFLDDGIFTVKEVPARRGRLVIRRVGSSKVLATVENVLPSADVSARDQKLAAIDLRAVMHVYDLRIVDQGDSPIEGVSLRLMGDAEPQPSFEPGIFNLRRAENPLHVELSAPAHSPLYRTLAPGKHVIAMEPRPEVPADPPKPVELPDSSIP